MRRNTVGLVWLVGVLLAVGVYAFGPDRFLRLSAAAVVHLQALSETVMFAFTTEAYELVRAAAIGCFVVFVVLALMASNRGLRGRAALIMVSGVFLLLLSPAAYGGYVSSSRWSGAFLVAAVGALTMTRRLVATLASRTADVLPHRPADNAWDARRP